MIDGLGGFEDAAHSFVFPSGDAPGVTAAGERPEAFESLRLTLTGHPAINAVAGTAPRTITGEEFDALRREHQKVWSLVHASRYSDLAPVVADLIPGLETASRAGGNAKQMQTARELLTDTYQAVAAMMAKVGETDTAWIAAERATTTAEKLGDPLTVAASLFRTAHVFLSLGQVAQAQDVASGVVKVLSERIADDPTPQAVSLTGAFHLVLAVAAARDNERAEAYRHLDQARDLAERIGVDRNDFGTEFGPTNVALHAVGVATELGDAGHALDLAESIDPTALSAERQARYAIDLAQAHAMRRHTGDALRCLEEAERLTPEQTRTHRVARAVARDLIQLAGTRARPELRELAERFGVLP